MSSNTIEVVPSSKEAMSTPEPGLYRQVMSYSPAMMLVRHTMTTGWVGTRHSHPHEQMVYIVSGRIRFEHPGGVFEVVAGDSFLVPGGVEHQASAQEDSEVLDIFTPMREEYANNSYADRLPRADRDGECVTPTTGSRRTRRPEGRRRAG
jgi:quercetin dioxygenase-like cupin family protein